MVPLLLICEPLSNVEVVNLSQLLSLTSDTKCGIERNNLFVAIQAEVFGRELDSISRPVGVHIDL